MLTRPAPWLEMAAAWIGVGKGVQIALGDHPKTGHFGWPEIAEIPSQTDFQNAFGSSSARPLWACTPFTSAVTADKQLPYTSYTAAFSSC